MTHPFPDKSHPQDEQNWERLVRLLGDPRCTGRYDLVADATKMIARLAGHVGQLEAALQGAQIRIDQLVATSSATLPRDELELIRAVLAGFPPSMARNEGLRAVLKLIGTTDGGANNG